MKKTFTLRIDLESDIGIREGLSPLLDLLKKYNLKASFYLTMGGESGLFELLNYRKKLESAGERKIRLFSTLQKLRIAFLPRDFVKRNYKSLKRILEEGHELGIHGWKHREWTRGLGRINIHERVRKSIKKYEELFGRKPESFSAPGFNTNERVLRVLEEEGIKYISDFPGDSVKKFGKITNVPITIKGKNNEPIIEYLVSRGYSEEQIIDIIKDKLGEKPLSSFYIHGMFEARFKLRILEEIFKAIKLKKLKNERIIDY